MEKVICVFGASTTWGAWDLEKGGWVNRLKLYFDAEANDDFYVTVYNLGIDGNDSNLLLKRFETECRARDPDIIIFSIGSNDSFINSEGKPNVSLINFEKNILKLVKKAKKFTKEIIFLGLYNFDESKTRPVSWDKNVNYINSNMNEYDKILRKVTAKTGVLYVEISGLINIKDFEDGVHPNFIGHEKIFNKVKDYLVENNFLK